MAVKYYCRHCQVMVGELEQSVLDSAQLGFHHLNEQERSDLISYQSNGDIHVKTICEDCQEALERNPEFHQLEKFIQ